VSIGQAELRRQIIFLRRKLLKLNKEREQLLKEKRALKEEIRVYVSKVRELKAKKQALTEELNSLMEEKNKLLEEIKKIRERLSEINEKYGEELKKLPSDVNPKKIRREIEILERILQTEVLSYKQEKEIIERIRKLEKKLMEIQENPIAMEFEELNRQLIEKQKELNIIKERIRDALMEKKKVRETMQELLKKLDELRARLKEIEDQYTKVKQEYIKTDEEIQKKLEMLAMTMGKPLPIEEIDLEAVKSKIKEIDEKLMRGEPITTEELLLLQQFESVR